MKRVFIGTAGWSIPRDHAAAFPVDGSHLERYAQTLNAVEINSTFYRRHRPDTFEKWRELVPSSFRFSVKMPKSITHEAQLHSPRALLKEFFDDVKGLKNKLGVILVQLPGSAAFEEKRVRAFLKTLRSLYDGRVAWEPRHASWYAPAVTELFEKHDIGRVAADPPRPEVARDPGGSSSLVYYRWHGSPRIYWSSYDDARLQDLSKKIQALPTRTQAWCIFDNTASGAAAGDALRLKRLIS
jgi:uncharacterized protein YecE (DUF72 family)